jgi:hypothetical protein
MNSHKDLSENIPCFSKQGKRLGSLCLPSIFRAGLFSENSEFVTSDRCFLYNGAVLRVASSKEFE